MLRWRQTEGPSAGSRTQMLTPVQGGTSYSYALALEQDLWRDERVIGRIPAPACSIQTGLFAKLAVRAHSTSPHPTEKIPMIALSLTSVP